MKLSIELDDQQLELLKQITKYDGSSTCMGDAIRRMIKNEARRLQISAPRVAPRSESSVLDELIAIMAGKR